ncbi:MAG: hypothetical protein C0613_14215 [Desulfobulbaceae bacterium]|nr:MAG: hypothetical protein C0613_14215 [Desulfobulbaceae bacterium]
MSSAGVIDRSYQYDLNSNITGIADNLATAKSQTYGYDSVNRLTSAAGSYGNLSYVYDSVGNRLTKTENAFTETLSYIPDTNQLQQVEGESPRTFSYDGEGNIVKDNDTSLVYSADNRLIKVIENNALKGDYVYNGRGQRVKKTSQAETVIYHYDQSGNLIAETDSQGALRVMYIYFGSMRLAKVEVAYEPADVGDVDGNGKVDADDALLVEQYIVDLITLDAEQSQQADVTLDNQVDAADALLIKQITNALKPMPLGPAVEKEYYYHNDHLGTSLAMTDAAGTVVWRADYLPFGKMRVDPPSTVVNNVRFPGQYYDEETGLHYNWHRYYDPGTGRYMTPDPIGLAGGDTNLYSYVWQNPINWSDPLGLWGVKLSIYWGYGGSITLGSNKGKLFLRGAVGVGAGGGLSYNPNADIPKSEDPCEDDPCKDSPEAFIGPSAWAGGGLGPASAGVAGHAGLGIRKGCDGRPDIEYLEDGGFYGTLSPKVGGWGVKLGGGVNLIDVGVSW